MKKIALLLTVLSFSAFAQVTSPVPPVSVKTCAIAYNSLNGYYTSALNIVSGARYYNLNKVDVQTGGDWDNRISKVSVAPGCTFIGYQYQNFNTDYHTGRQLDGFALVLGNEYSTKFKVNVLNYENEKISSIKCFCRN